jgi:putative restriction endonuclease
MKEGQRLWTRDELILAVNLYCKLPFGKMHRGNPDIIDLANIIQRSPSAIARKLGNFASFDPTLKARGIGGLPNAGKLDGEIWNEFYNDWNNRLIESEKLLARYKHTTIEKISNIEISDLPMDGIEKERMVKSRVNQSIFRKMILATYNSSCCITGIDKSELLVASHIVPWSKDESNRLNPMNGLCLNALHDRAFDAGLITISANDYTVLISHKLKSKNPVEAILQNFIRYDGIPINLPDKFLPDKEFLKLHNEFFSS